MSGFFGVASKENCVLDVFFGVDYHSHLGTRRGGMAIHGEKGFAVPFITSRILRFVRNSKKILRNLMEILESDVFQTMRHSRFW